MTETLRLVGPELEEKAEMGNGTRSRWQRNKVIWLAPALALVGASAIPGGVGAVAPSHPWAWGFNKYEQLCMALPPHNHRQLTPVERPAPTGVVGVAAGLNHSVFVTTGGLVYQCGEKPAGTATYDEPELVSFGGRPRITAVAAGDRLGVALAENGTVWTWGENTHGQLGNATPTARTTPAQVAGLSGVTAISAGRKHVVALKNDGTVWSWGSNTDGQLGDGSAVAFSSSPVQVRTDAATTLTGVTRIGAGGYHNLAVITGGTLKSWGLNSDGQLGNGTTTSSSYAIDVSHTGLGSIDQVVGGNRHSLARQTDGRLMWAWGAGDQGQLGNGAFHSSSTPLPVVSLTGVTDIAAGPSASHSMAIGPRGTVWTWGWNFYGQLGNGTTLTVNDNIRTGPNSPVPTLALDPGLVGATDVAAGGTFSFAVIP